MSSTIAPIQRQMDSAVSAFSDRLNTLRTGRAFANLLDPIRVEAYDSVVPLEQVANVSVGDARTLLVSVWDKTIVNRVDRAIRESRLGLNPIVDGTTLRIPLPAPTEERRKELVKLSKEYAEEFKVQIRNIRRDANDRYKREKAAGKIPDHVVNSQAKKIQEATDLHIEKIVKLQQVKEKEILSL